MKTILIICICLIAISCRQSKNTDNELIKFNNVWSSPYHPSLRYCTQLTNAEGKFLFVLNKTERAYFACKYHEKVIENVKKHGANVIRVCLEGAPYLDVLGYDNWPWEGTREKPDYDNFNDDYWNEVEKRIELAGKNGLGIDIVLYFSLKPKVSDIKNQKSYWNQAIKRLSRYSNILT